MFFVHNELPAKQHGTAIVRGTFILGIAVGGAAALVGPSVWRVARPLAKAALRAGLEGYGAARIAGARMAEEAEDLFAEVMHEIDEATAQAAVSDEAAVAAAGGAHESASKA